MQSEDKFPIDLDTYRAGTASFRVVTQPTWDTHAGSARILSPLYSEEAEFKYTGEPVMQRPQSNQQSGSGGGDGIADLNVRVAVLETHATYTRESLQRIETKLDAMDDRFTALSNKVNYILGGAAVGAVVVTAAVQLLVK